MLVLTKSEEKVKELESRLKTEHESMTGCAHSGIRSIASRAQEIASIAWLVGGLHDASVPDIPKGCEKIVPCHCTSRKAEIGSAFGQAVEIQ